MYSLEVCMLYLLPAALLVLLPETTVMVDWTLNTKLLTSSSVFLVRSASFLQVLLKLKTC